MTEYYEIAQHDTGHAGMVARKVSPTGPFIRERFYDPAPIVEGPEIIWSWDAPAPMRDWCPAITRTPVFSRRMADVVRTHIGPLDAVEWVAATVLTPDGATHKYEMPHFLEYPDIYDELATEWGPSGLPTRWVLSREKLQGRHFVARWRSAGTVIISEVMRTALIEAEVTGVDVRSVRISG